MSYSPVSSAGDSHETNDGDRKQNTRQHEDHDTNATLTDDELVDEQIDESFPASDPPSHL